MSRRPRAARSLTLLFACLLASGCGRSAGTPTASSATPAPIFGLGQTVRITPDAQYLTGCFARINYVPARDRFVVTFGGLLAQQAGGCPDKAFSYKSYTTALQETGESGTFACDIADAGSVMVDNTYYHAAMANSRGRSGWHLMEIDAVDWRTLVDTFFPIDHPTEGDADPMVAYVNGRIDISSAYNPSGRPHEPTDPPGTYGTHHQFFSRNLEFLGRQTLTQPGHIHGSSLVYVDGVYHFVTADAYDGNVIVARYDQGWSYLGGKTLVQQAHFATGLAYDRGRFYLAYTDTRLRASPGFFPVSLNIRLAAFDASWNLLQDVAVTDYSRSDNMQPGRPWLVLRANRLYVSYDVDTVDPVTREERLRWQAQVAVFDLVG